MARQYDRAIQQLRNTLEMDPSYELPHLVLGLSYAQKGDFSRALPELRKAVELSHGTPLMISALATASARSGNKDEAEKLLADLISESKKQYVSPYYFALVYVGLGQRDKAIDLLEKAYAELNAQPDAPHGAQLNAALVEKDRLRDRTYHARRRVADQPAQHLTPEHLMTHVLHGLQHLPAPVAAEGIGVNPK